MTIGIFDTVIVGKHDEQLKCWNPSFALYHLGDAVPPLPGTERQIHTYSIQLGGGGRGYFNIERDRIAGWSKRPRHRLVIDKWGWVVQRTSMNEGVGPDFRQGD